MGSNIDTYKHTALVNVKINIFKSVIFKIKSSVESFNQGFFHILGNLSVLDHMAAALNSRL